MDSNPIFDDTLFSILKECSTLPNFLDTVFGFLSRRTDFYVVASEPKSPVGLPPGWAEYFVKQAFFKWKPPDVYKDINDDVPEISNEIIIEDSPTQNQPSDNIEVNKSKKEIKNQSECATLGNSKPSQSYNGATFDNYAWSQNITDVDIIVKLPEKTNTKDLSVSILPQSISVKIKSTNTTLLDGELCQRVKYNDAVWSSDKNELEIHLDKVSEMWWDCLVKDEPKIDVTKIDCSRPFEDLPEDAQAKIEELTWNRERKRLGLPTSDELAVHEKLKKAWDVEGSPFKGSAYDPDIVVMTP